MGRRLDPVSVAGLVLAALSAALFVDWLAAAAGATLPRDTKGFLPMAGALAAGLKGDHEVTQAVRWVFAAAGIGGSALAALIFVRAPNNAPARQVAWVLIAYALFTFAAHFVGIDRRYTYARVQGWVWIPTIGLFVFLALGIARFLVIFPRAVDFAALSDSALVRRGRGAAPWRGAFAPLLRRLHDPQAQSVLLVRCHAMLVDGRLLLAGPLGVVALLTAIHVAGRLAPSAVWGGIVFTVAVVGLGFLGLVLYPFAGTSTAYLYRNGTGDERRRVGWLRTVLILAGIAALFLTAASFFSPFVIKRDVHFGFYFAGFVFMGWALLPTALILGLAFAVLYGGALDPRVAMTRMTLWTGLGLGITVLFLLLERLVAVKLVALMGLPTESGLVLAGGAIAATFVPLRRAAERAVTRLADRYLPLEVVADGLRVVKTVAITDLSGYTALAARDEAQALMQGALLKRQAERIVTAHGGKLVKSMGDAVMLTFQDSRDAVNAVASLHRGYPPACDALGMSPLPLHTALNAGEIVESHDGDIYGQTVNVCARLVDAARAGEIVVSESVRACLGERPVAVDIGERSFKNVPNPVRCYRLEPRIEEPAVA